MSKGTAIQAATKHGRSARNADLGMQHCRLPVRHATRTRRPAKGHAPWNPVDAPMPDRRARTCGIVGAYLSHATDRNAQESPGTTNAGAFCTLTGADALLPHSPLDPSANEPGDYVCGDRSENHMQPFHRNTPPSAARVAGARQRSTCIVPRGTRERSGRR